MGGARYKAVFCMSKRWLVATVWVGGALSRDDPYRCMAGKRAGPGRLAAVSAPVVGV